MASTALRVVLDGSTLEGGGQILRNAVAFSALLTKPVQINNVRQNRPQPGLKAQHVAGLRLVAHLCGASAAGIDKGSRAVVFEPDAIRAGDYTADPGTAGSTTLLLQIALPCLLFSEPPSPPSGPEPTDAQTESEAGDLGPVVSTLTLRGGTNALHAPPADYAQAVLLPFLHTRLRLPHDLLTLEIKKRGFFPHGGGELRARVPGLRRGTTLPPVTLTERGTVTTVRGRAYVSGPLPARVAAQMRDAALAKLASYFAGAEAGSADAAAPPAVHIDILADTLGPMHRAGSGLVLWAETSTGCVLGASALGEKGTHAAKTGSAAAAELVRNLWHGGCVDEYMQDQMIMFLALAKGKSTVRTGPLTLHSRTAIWVAEMLTGAKFDVKVLQDVAGQVLISCEGIGLEGRL